MEQKILDESNVQLGKRYFEGHLICNLQGYDFIAVNGKDILLHRYVMERHLGRSLLSTEIVHHRDGNRRNNHLDNLELIPWGKHTSLHRKGVSFTEEHKRNLSNACLGRKLSAGTIEKIRQKALERYAVKRNG